jgi:hypothetical protein
LEYGNLYYACLHCNGIKGSKWPAGCERLSCDACATLECGGEVFADCCERDPNVIDFVLQDDGKLAPKTPSGKYTISQLLLNERPYLVRHRKLSVEKRREVDRLISELREKRDQLSPSVALQYETRLKELREYLSPQVLD